ncbi:RNA degradosome polyphosphate kinase [Alicyclobacillus mali (ex Roth et al. 2021)]|uniref:RNA degradosome polyphosphate kinase n=1 Tax=Alicyclobacillus mali (ex Roth et al. 2021) TaxID=1123961 RepID=UPI0022B24350|nr:RNA degradosome polyphosphate kinase [Alicyclobacillus mali (ex Roth et al. 2021)]
MGTTMTLDHHAHFINREVSWLLFNERVAFEAARGDNPLFERLRFLAICASNLDEFFMVRVAGLKDQLKLGVGRPDNKTGMTAAQQLAEVANRAHAHVNHLYRLWNKTLLPALRKENIDFVQPSQLTQAQRAHLEEYYHHHVFPVLTPLAVDASHPFPLLANRSLNIAVLLEPIAVRLPHESPLFAVVQVPSVLPRYLELPTGGRKRVFVPLEAVIEMFIDTLFPGHTVLEHACFRITRNADITVDEESAEDLLEEIEREVKKRNRGAAVRLEVQSSMSSELVETLRDWLELEADDIYSIDGPLDLTFLMRFSAMAEYAHLRFPPISPQVPPDFIGENGLFEAIAKRDILLFHPYESFDPVVHFIHLAANDPQVLAIKQTLYRVSGNSPIVHALARAAENGKQVTVLVELKARFDEENNIVWAKKLEEAGCHVIYGLVGLKTHSKIALVVRREGERIVRYVHLSTGNYNDNTARLYTDLGMFTAREEFGEDASLFFNHLTGFADPPAWRRIATAPHGLKDAFLKLIQREVDHARAGRPARMIAKMNALTDKDLILALFEASQAGVEIDLLVRGICCLRPGIPNVSDRIRVSSIVGRFLEHSRIYYFLNGGEEEYYLASADWMTRNMVSRVEILFPVLQDNLKQRLKHILDVQLRDNVNRWILAASGQYEKVEPKPDEPKVASQMQFYLEACGAADETAKAIAESMIPRTPPRLLP